MKATFQVRPDLCVEVEGETHKDLFRELAGVAEVFGERQCGLCGSADIVPAYRTVAQGKKTFEYPEWHCPACGARLAMGSMMEGGRLFPHRKLDSAGKPDREHGTAGKHHGWTRFKGEPRDAAGPEADPAPTGDGRSRTQKPGCITPERWKEIHACIVDNKLDVARVLAHYKISRPGELPQAQAADCLKKAQAGYAAWKSATSQRGAAAKSHSATGA
jgi:hypothetical protein